MITFDTDASLEWCSTSPLWHIAAVGRGVHPIGTFGTITLGCPLVPRKQRESGYAWRSEKGQFLP